MPDKKLTDNETVKALERLIELTSKDLLISNNGVTYGNVLDLINRLQAENDRLKQNLEEAHIDIREHLAENERLENHLAMSKKETKRCVTHYKMACSERNEFLEQLKTAKAEAYKEFAERLKEKYTNKKLGQWNFEKAFIKQIDNLLKELVGEDNG